MSDGALITKYRPAEWDEVVGNGRAIDHLRRALAAASSMPHSFLFTGPSGTGKTTLARIIGKELKADIVEIDAASNAGVADARQIVEFGEHASLHGDGKRLIIIDECFAAGSLVDTPKGAVPIEQLQKGDAILGAQGEANIGKIIKTRVELSRIVQLRLATGQTIVCSEDHPFLTPQGWIEAKNVQSISTLRAQLSTPVLQMWDSIYEQRRWFPMLSNLLTQDLPGLRRGILESGKHLFPDMRQQDRGQQTNWPATRGLETINAGSATEASGQPEGQRVSSYAFRAHDAKQSNALPSCYTKDDGNQKRQWNIAARQTLARGQRARTDHPTSCDPSGVPGQHYGTCYSHRDVGSSQNNRISPCLQSRHSLSGYQACDRDRREHSSISGRPRPRSKEGPMSSTIRVESVAHLQPADIQRLRQSGQTHQIGDKEYADFYDLTIDGHPSFSIEGCIVHNCHTLSKPAWQALLKILEEPPRHLFFALCTTELDKIIETVRQRCYHCILKPVSREDTQDLLDAIIAAEHMQVKPDVMQMIVQECNGSPRKAISLLQVAHDAPNKAEAQRIISLQDASDPLKELLQLFVSGRKTWPLVRDLLLKIKEQDSFEDSVMQAGGYMAAVLINQEDEKRARMVWQLLDALLFPVTTFDRKQQFIAAVGRMMWGG